MSAKKQTAANQSVEKSIKIIETLAHSSEPMRLLDISEVVEMPACTTLRLINSLQNHGYIYQDEQKRYSLTLRLLHLGQLAAEKFSLRDIIHPHLIEISQLSGESCCAAVKNDRTVRYIDVIESNVGMIRIRQIIGGSAKLHCTGSGKLFLMDFSPSELEAFFSENTLPKLTNKTLTTKDSLIAELNRCREQGYALDNEECELGVSCIAVPIRDNRNKTLAVVSISGPTARMTEDRIQRELLPLLYKESAEIEEKLGF